MHTNNQVIINVALYILLITCPLTLFGPRTMVSAFWKHSVECLAQIPCYST